MSFNNTKSPTNKDIDPKKVRYQVPRRKSRRGPMEFYLEGEVKDKFTELFPRKSNKAVMQMFGIGFSTVQRFKRELGLEKDMKVIKHEQAQQIKKLCEKNGYYDSLRGKRLSEQAYRAAEEYRKSDRFVHPMKAMKKKHPRKYKNRMKKKSEERKKLISDEKRRDFLGLSHRSNLNYKFSCDFKPFTSVELSKRYNAIKRMYILGDPDPRSGERYVIYYDEHTNRAPIFEGNCRKCGFTILQLV